VPDVVALDRSVISWLLAASGAFILFLLGLGFKDAKDHLRKVDRLCLEIERIKSKNEADVERVKATNEADIERLRTKYDRDVAELRGIIGVLDQRIENLHAHLKD
jgi:hypothetical protein